MLSESEGSVVGMSDEAVMNAGTKNDLEKWKLLNEMDQIINDEKLSIRSKGKELRKLQDDMTMMVAEGFVYREHCFGKYDPFKSPTERENFHVTDQSYDSSKKNTSTNTLPAIIEAKAQNDKTLKCMKDEDVDAEDSQKDVFPPLALSLLSKNVTFHNQVNTAARSPPRPRNLSQPVVHIPTDGIKSDRPPLRKAASEVQCLKVEERLSFELASPRSEVSKYEYESDSEEEEGTNTKVGLFSSLTSSLHGLVMWRNRAREKAVEKELERQAEVKKKHKRFLPKSTPSTISPDYKAMFPGNCKTYYAMKKFVHKEAEKMINQSDSPMYEKRRERLRKLINKAALPQFIRRDRTTSAIFRDFKNYQTHNKLNATTTNH